MAKYIQILSRFRPTLANQTLRGGLVPRILCHKGDLSPPSFKLPAYHRGNPSVRKSTTSPSLCNLLVYGISLK
jgi:hypothetical protein